MTALSTDDYDDRGGLDLRVQTLMREHSELDYVAALRRVVEFDERVQLHMRTEALDYATAVTRVTALDLSGADEESMEDEARDRASECPPERRFDELVAAGKLDYQDRQVFNEFFGSDGAPPELSDRTVELIRDLSANRRGIEAHGYDSDALDRKVRRRMAATGDADYVKVLHQVTDETP